MITSLLIANRGEIACRIIRTARAMGIRTVAVCSEADRKALFVRMADQVVEIGPAPARDSYLCGDKIIAAALSSGAEAIHPGYGFLSENADFAEAVVKAGLIFVGPPASSIRAMGLKDAAKALVEKAGVPVVPGYHGAGQEAEFLANEAAKIGYPVLIKAVAGGGGKGMRKVDAPQEFAAALASAQREGQASFGDPRVLIERCIQSPRHIEIQIFADRHGNCVHLFERDCSLQRRHQKVIEEAPAPDMPQAVREAMGKAAVEAAKAVGYVGAGTIEFIADGARGLTPDGFFFMEMNTRLQVEHPVTELITGLDLVALQLKVASGEALPFAQSDLAICGHAVEARLYAEDPERGFLPSTGHLHRLAFPQGEGLRIDAGVEQGDEVTPYYDPMIAKLIAYGPDRDTALDRLAAALEATQVAGPRCNARFLAALCRSEGFRQGRFDTGYIEAHLDDLGAVAQPVDGLAALAGVKALLEAENPAFSVPANTVSDPWSLCDAFQLTGARRLIRQVLVEGEPCKAELVWPHGGEVVITLTSEQGVLAGPASVKSDAHVSVVGDRAYVLRHARQTLVAFADPSKGADEHGAGDGLIKAPMHGKVVAMMVAVGDQVMRGQRLAVVEAMKMEHGLAAPCDGTVKAVHAAEGQQVGEGSVMIEIDTKPE